jgi:protein AaeX
VRFTEINLFGVYVAPISVMMVVAWVVTILLRRFAARFGLLRYVWHPALFVFAVYIIVLSAIVLAVAHYRPFVRGHVASIAEPNERRVTYPTLGRPRAEFPDHANGHWPCHSTERFAASGSPLSTPLGASPGS